MQLRPLRRCGLALPCAAALWLTSPQACGESDPPSSAAAYAPVPGVISVPETTQATLGLADIKVGMRGYGLSVFHGSEIEPFAFEVRSVAYGRQPGQAVIWVSCTDERMQKHGPVQGMSGSPMYVWGPQEENVLGQGGRLIGAFAFGFSQTNECMVGVQPIEYMRAVGERTPLAGAGVRSARRPSHVAGEVVANLLQAADKAATPAWGRTGLDFAADVARRTPGFALNRGPSGVSAPNHHGPRPLALPVALGSVAVAEAARPFFEPLNLAALAAPTSLGGPAPSNVDVEGTRIEPGAVLAIPLAFGDWTPAATGTVTDVEPDGTVLGFGHAMDGQGATALPMASGFTHFVVSRRDISFKLAGPLKVAGTLLQDESTAVSGRAEAAFETAPSRVRVSMPGHPTRSYAYDVVQHPGYAPSLAPLTAVVSLGAEQAPPEQSTTRATGRVSFSDGTALEVDITLPLATPSDLAFELGPPMTMMLLNPFEDVELSSMDLDLKVEPGVNLAFLQDARVQPSVAAPGEEVEVSVVLQPYLDGVPRTERFKLQVPPNAADGILEFTISDGATALNRLQYARPAWDRIDSLAELREQLQMSLTLKRRAVHVTLLGEDLPAFTLGQTPLPGLPNTFAAVLANPAASAARVAPAVVQHVHEVPEVIAGRLSVAVEVRRADPPN